MTQKVPLRGLQPPGAWQQLSGCLLREDDTTHDGAPTSGVDMSKFIARNWRGFLARLPLPMLGLAASYGVYRFALLFVPGWVAIVTASSFEFVYIGLAVYDKFGERERKSALYVSLAAVVTSILYNVLDGFFHRRPDLLAGLPWFADLMLSVVHGAPLAVLAFLVSRLVMHPSGTHIASSHSPSQKRQESPETLVGGRASEFTMDSLKTFLDGVENFKRSDVTEALGCSPATASRLLQLAIDDGLVVRNNGSYVVIGEV